MLDGYISEKEQLESIRKWWNDYGKQLFLAIIIGLLIGFAWRQWHKLSLEKAENASVIYQQVLQADHDQQFAKVQGGVAILQSHFDGTPYASLGTLLLAKESVQQNQLPQALSQLDYVISHGNNDRLKTIAKIEAARILLAQSKPQAAAAMISKIKDKGFLPLVTWIKGDIATQEGDAASAQKYYAEAKNNYADFPPAATLLTQLSAN